jgi:hypothetical protein
MTCPDEASMTLDYARYLAAKTTVDDRALNRHVLAELRCLMPAGAPRVLEVGAGLGTMAARLMDCSCWIVLAGGCATGRPRGACAATCSRTGCG